MRSRKASHFFQGETAMGMLVLSRRQGEEIIIDGQITVTLVQIKGSQARIGITAPKNVRVDRAEVHARRKDKTTTNAPRA